MNIFSDRSKSSVQGARIAKSTNPSEAAQKESPRKRVQSFPYFLGVNAFTSGATQNVGVPPIADIGATRQIGARQRDRVFMKLFALLLTLSMAAAGEPALKWPAMPTKFVSGRLATHDDLANGNAVFFIEAAGRQLTTPTQKFRIPQFGYLIEARKGRRPVVLVQAELLDGDPVLGLRDADGEMYIASEKEVELLGPAHP